MARTSLTPIWPCVLISALLPTSSLANADCDDLLAEIDRRIATGNYSEQNVNGAQIIRSTFKGMCAQIGVNFPGDLLENMQATVEDILPTKSEEERRAAQEKRWAAEAEEVTKRRVEAAQRRAGDEVKKRAAADVPPQPVFAVLKAAPTAKSVVAQFMDRPDNMNNVFVQDKDVFEGRARILYKTVPSVPQYNSPDWLLYFYSVEITTNGVVTQRLIVSDKDSAASRNVFLRRGFDEIIRHRFPRPAGKEPALERWSISGTKLVSSTPVPNPPWPGGNPGRWRIAVATSDGNVLYTEQRTGRTGPTTLAWFESSPGGAVLGRGSISDDGKNLYYGGKVFETNNGGGGIVFSTITNVTIGIPNSETRFLITSNDATTAWESVAIDRLFDFDNNRATSILMIKPTADGYAVLSNLVANLQPPVHGPYLLELDESGIRAETYLNPIAEQLDIKITMFDVSENNDSYLFGTDGNGRGVVVLLDGNGEPKAYGRATTVDNANIKYEGMLSNPSGVWLYGTGGPDKESLWVERIEFP